MVQTCGWDFSCERKDSIFQQVAASLNLSQTKIEEVYPCTPLQEALITLSTAGSGAYVKRIVLCLAPDTNCEKFCAAVEDVVQSTAILRTRIVQCNHVGFVQVVLSEEIFWSQENCLEEHLERTKSMKLGVGDPLVRYTLVNDNHGTIRWFVWTIHHALYDGWSFPLMVDKVRQRYAGNPLESTVQYKDFAKHIMTKNREGNEAYWQSVLAGTQYTQFPILPKVSYMPAADRVVEEHCPPLRRVKGITRTTLLRAAWAVVLNHFTDSDDLVFGTIVSGRDEAVAGIKDLIGPTVATIPMRVRMSGVETTRMYLERLHAQAQEMRSFDQWGLHAISKINSDTRQACSFQTLLVVQPADDGHVITNDIGVWRRVETDVGRSAYGLTVQCFLNKTDIRMVAAFDSSVLDVWKVQKMLERFSFVSHQLADSSPSQLMEHLQTTMSPQDLRGIWEWNAVVPASAEACVHDLIAETVQQQPHSPAVHAWDGKLTYKELDDLSNQLAYHLVSLGVVPETMVPLCFEKSMWMTVAMLGVMKAGGVLVPVDVSQAADRARSILDDIQPRLIVTSRKYKDFAHQLGYRTVQPETVVAASQWNQNGTFTKVNTAPQSAAYVIFTSGSTGKPKGVVIEHKAASTSFLAHGAKLGLSQTSRFLQFSSHSFDASIMEILTTFVHRGCVCVPSDASRLDQLTETINEMSVNTAFLTPSVARLLYPDQVPTLQTLAIGGEHVSTVDTGRWMNLLRLLEVYGPTECTILSVMQVLTGKQVSPQTIGKAVGSVAWVVDPNNHDNLVPVGAVGELLIEGNILARGYLNDPARTTAVFIEDPLWLLQGADGYPGRHGRLYKTGDLVQYNADGTLCFIGRKDTQVKIRGQRVELGEVEFHVQRLLQNDAQLTSNILVAAEVITPQDSSQPTLVAFVCPGGIEPESEGSHLKERCAAAVADMVSGLDERLVDVLPSHMIPTAFIPIVQMPMTTTGKTDRRQLRDVGNSLTRFDLASLGAQVNSLKRLPMSDVERTLQQIWARILNVTTEIGLDDNFFSLGGDSISAMQISVVARSHGLHVSVNDIMLNNTLTKLSNALQAPNSSNHLSVATTDDVRYPFNLSPIQQFHFDTRSLGPDFLDLPFFLRLTKHIPLQRVNDALHALVRRHSMLRARFSRDKTGTWSQYICESTEGSLLFKHLRKTRESEKAAAIADCRASIDIEHGPSFIAALFEDDEGQTLFLTAHHLVIDFVSWRVLFQDLEDFMTLEKFTSPTSTSFQKWCVLQNEYASKHLEPEVALHYVPSYPSLDYWDISEDEPGKEVYTRKQFFLDNLVSAAILGSCSERFQVRPHELMMAALFYSFTRVFQDRALPPIFTEGHGRGVWDDSVDFSQTVGWFTIMFPVQVEANEGDDVLDFILKTRECLRNMPRQGWPYFASKYLNEKGRKTFQDDPVEINFNFLGQFQQLERESSLMEAVPLPTNCKPAGMAPIKTVGLFDVTVIIERGQIQVDFKYNVRVGSHEKIRSWIRMYEKVLVDIVKNIESGTLYRLG